MYHFHTVEQFFSCNVTNILIFHNVINIFSRSTMLEDGVHLLGAFSDIKLAQHVENAIIDVSGEGSLGWCQIFKRAKIHGEVFHSKSYGRVFRRNSHTVTYEDNQKRIKCGQIMYFLRHTPICQNACVGLCKCHREQYFAVIVNLRPQQDFQLTEADQIQRIQKQIQVMQRPRYLKILHCLDIDD